MRGAAVVLVATPPAPPAPHTAHYRCVLQSCAHLQVQVIVVVAVANPAGPSAWPG